MMRTGSGLSSVIRGRSAVIKRRGGETFSLTCKTAHKSAKSPFDVPGVKTGATTRDILDAIKESRSRRNSRRTMR